LYDQVGGGEVEMRLQARASWIAPPIMTVAGDAVLRVEAGSAFLGALTPGKDDGEQCESDAATDSHCSS